MKRANKNTVRFSWRASLLPGLIYFALAGAMPVTAYGQLELFTNREAQCVFAGDARKISLVWHNAGDKTTAVEIRSRLYQTSFATTVFLNEAPWKELQVLPQQTVLESAQLDFPAVKAETKFLVQWIENSNPVLGKTEVLVYPTNLLGELKPLLGEDNLGVLDPNNELKPLLKRNGVAFLDLEEMPLEDFQGRLAIIGPFQSKAQMSDGLAAQIKMLAKKNAAVVWLRPPPEKRDKLSPSFYFVMENTNAVVVAQADLISNLPENPQSQMNLIYFCKLAMNPAPLSLPNLNPEP
jgi:hypothetical protein